MNRIIVSFFALLAAAPLAAQEQTPRVLSLDEALEITLSGSPVIEASRYEEKAAQQERRAAIGLRMPQISVGGTYTYLGKDIGFDFNDLKGPVGNITHDILGSGLIPTELIPQIQQLLTPVMGADWFLTLQDRSLGFVGGQVTLPIYMGGKINTANRAAKINEKTAVEQGNQNRNALVSELVERYYGLALARQVVEVRQQVVDGVGQHLKDAIALEQNGMIPHSERLYVEFKMAEAERELQNARLQVETIASALNNTLGQQAEVLPVTTMFVLGNLEDVAYYKDLAAKFNPLLSQVALKRQLAKEGVRLQRANFLPQVAAMGGASFYNYQVTKIMPRWAVGVGVNLKIFGTLALKSTLQITAVNFFLYLAVLPIIVITCRKAGSFLVGVIIAFVYGYGGMFAAGNMTLANIYPITASLGMVGYRNYDTAVHWNIVACMCSLVFVVIISAVFILCMKETEPQKAKKKAKKVITKKGW